MPWSKAHRNEYTKRWQRANLELVKVYNFKTQLKKKYGLSLEDFEKLWQSQKGLCKVCGKVLVRRKGGYAIDHDHNTMKIRGIICQHCNASIGWYERYKLKLQDYLRL
jgi:hypothetical protein